MKPSVPDFLMNINLPYIPLDCPVCGRELIRSRTVTPFWKWLSLSCPETIPDPIHNEKNEFQLKIDIFPQDNLYFYHQFASNIKDVETTISKLDTDRIELWLDSKVSFNLDDPESIRKKIKMLLTFQ